MYVHLLYFNHPSTNTTLSMTIRIAAALLMGTIALYSCRKASQSTSGAFNPTPNTYSLTMGMKKGNYWIYQLYRIDTAGVETPGITDSVYVDKDTVINGRIYYKFVEASVNYYWRDSSEYILNPDGEIIYTGANFADTFWKKYNDPYLLVYKKMADKGLTISVPAGTFATNTMQTTYSYLPGSGSYYAGKNRYWNVRFANGIGIVVQTTLLGDYYYYERRLLRYHVAL